jgi:hypothetical protein
MKQMYFILCLCAALSASMAHGSQAMTKVAAQGETHLDLRTGIIAVQVTIDAHKIMIGSPSDPIPKINKTNCTYSKYPCSIVDWIGISIDGKKVIVPRSAFADLADLNDADIKVTKSGWIIDLGGGDGAESYIVHIYFDTNSVKRRTVFSGMDPESVLEETTYHQLVMD